MNQENTEASVVPEVQIAESDAVERSEDQVAEVLEAAAPELPAEAAPEVEAVVETAVEAVEAPVAEVPAEVAPVEPAPEVERSAGVVEVNTNANSEILDAVRAMFDGVNATLKSLSDEIAEVKRENESLVSANTELTDRLNRVESQPATVPGILQGISRGVDGTQMTNEELRTEAKRVAVEKNDKEELMKLVLNRNYLGKGN